MQKAKKFFPILLGSDMNVYGMARSFHEAYGIKSEAYAASQLAPTRFSNIVTVNVVDGFDHEKVFMETMDRLAKEKYNDPDETYLLIACGDAYAELVSQHKEELSQWFVCPYVGYELFQQLSSKVSFYETCEAYQLPYPKTFVIKKELLTDGRFEQELPFAFPIAMKPADSVEYLSIDFEGRKKAFIIDDRAEFDVIVERIYAAGYTHEMIVQDFIPGDDSHMRVLNAYVDAQHNVRMMCLGHPLLEDPYPAAIGNYVAILPDENEKIYQKIKAFLENIKYVGYANFDMKYDARDGEYKLFEINLRQGRSSFFVTLNGFNLATYFVDEYVHEQPFTETVYGKKDGPNSQLWLGVPQNIFVQYARNNPEKKAALDLIKAGRFGMTVFYRGDHSLRHWGLMKYMFYKYHYRFDTFFKEKEG